MPVSSQLIEKDQLFSVVNKSINNSQTENLLRSKSSTLDCSAELKHLKLLSTLCIMTDELTTLANSDYEIPGGQLRLKLYCWLERECELLKNICYPGESEFEIKEDDEISQSSSNIILDEDSTM